MRHDPAAEEPTPAELPPSKSQRKRESHELQSLGRALSELSDAQLAQVQLPENLRDALTELRRTRSHEGLRRQMQYLGKLMRDVDPEPIREAVARAHLPNARATLALHRLERWRDDLLADDGALTRLAGEHPQLDLQRLRSLVRAARRDAADTGERKGRGYRELFQFLKENLPNE